MSVTAMWLGRLALLALVAIAPSREAGAQPEFGNFLVAHVRVFDGERVHEDTQVAVEGGVIREVGRDLAKWRHLPVIDGTDATLIPGLIDAHAHVRSVDDLEDAVRFGVTTVLDLAVSGVTPQDLAELRNLAASHMDIADVLSAGFAATTAGGHGTAFRSARVGEIPSVASAKDADAFVATRQSEGSDYLKIFLNGVRTADQGMPNLDEPRVKALVGAAHSRGMLAVAHVETVEDAEIALRSGVDGLAHVWRRGGANADLARRLAANGVFVITTLVIPDGLLEGRAALLTDSRVQAFLSSREKEQLSRSYAPRTGGATSDERRATFDAVRSLHQAGVKLLVGSDASMVTPGVETTAPSVHGLSVHRELELLLNAGLSPTEALTAATMRTADAFRLADRGRIAAGRKADMVLVRGDPTSDVTATRDILRVWRSGVEFDRALDP